MAGSGGTTGSPIVLSTGGSGSGSLDPFQPLPYTLLGLQRYAQLMQIVLPHFQQMNGPLAPTTGGCDDIWDQDARDYLAWTILQAEEMIATELGFWPAPKFITDEQLNFGLEGVRSDWLNAEVKTQWGYVEAFGTEQLTLVAADAAVLYSNMDNDPLSRPELGRIGSATLYADLAACDNVCDVAIFFTVADGAEDAADERWEIRPTKIDIDGSTMRITAPASLFVKPELWALTEADCAGTDDPTKWKWNYALGNLVSTVDVYCRTVNTTLPVTLKWDGVCGCTTAACAHSTQTACAYDTDKRRGYFIPRPASGSNTFTTPTYVYPPESVTVNYRAGYPLDPKTCRMNAQLERAIVKLTNALLPEPPCGYCDAADIRWRNDRKNVDPLTPEAASMPWDLYTQGALEAWRIIKKFARGRGGKL